MRRLLISAALAVGLATPAMAQGTLRVAVGSTLNNLDPAKTTIGDEYIFVHLVFNGIQSVIILFEPYLRAALETMRHGSASGALTSFPFLN